jgi:hypothetical protein
MDVEMYPWGSETSVVSSVPGNFAISSFFLPSRVSISMTSSGTIWLVSIVANQINLMASDANVSATISAYR